ncbi:MAG: glycine cleavage system aminomethyltransferase GcvT [Rhodospirillales bacterium]|nr:glycine cleavage system aminomethyltransferase GcvT [Rhodospirillales bacterium]MDE2574796.1 glycine cleavage system aminomethyltransferase GcvT [Rhodospirillales bacterium]
MSTDHASASPLLTTPLDALHRELGARMVPFAGYAMPVQYPAGIMAEHLHCRAQAALFDVSHMGQASLHGAGAAAALEALVPGDIAGLKPGRQRYTLLTMPGGGILDDLMVANAGGEQLFLVVNASRKAVDLAHIAAHLPAPVRLEAHDERALLALQGPAAAAVLARLAPDSAAFPFMGFGPLAIAGIACLASRSGYTGEDGFEISVPAAQAEALARALLAAPEVQPAGLGARDSLRLEAGLCLYGNDIDETTNPIEAGLGWVIGKRRKAEWNFPGAAAIRAMLEDGPPRLRVGILPEGRAPARAGTAILDAGGAAIGQVTSGGFGPSLGAPLAMGYVPARLAAEGTPLHLLVRDKPLPARVAAMPFLPHRYIR